MYKFRVYLKAGIFLLALVALGTVSSSAQQSAGTNSYPSGDEIIAKYEKFLGGKTALAKVTTRKMSSRRIVESGAPDESTLIRYSKRPNLSIMQHRNLDGSFDVWQNGCDGNAGWGHGAGDAVRDFPAAASAGPICHQELFYYGYFPLDADAMKQAYKEITVKTEFKFIQPSIRGYEALAGGVGKDLVPAGLRDAYLVLALPAHEGDNPCWLVFDKETGALLRRQFNRSTDPGDVAYTSFLQYRQVGDGTVAPFQFVTQNKIFTVHEIVLKIEDNLLIDDQMFVKPKSATKEDKGLH